MKQRQWRTTIEEDKQRQLEQARYKSHKLYEDSDVDKPDVICDSNGQVALGLCKLCGRVGAELFYAMCEGTRKAN